MTELRKFEDEVFHGHGIYCVIELRWRYRRDGTDGFCFVLPFCTFGFMIAWYCFLPLFFRRCSSLGLFDLSPLRFFVLFNHWVVWLLEGEEGGWNDEGWSELCIYIIRHEFHYLNHGVDAAPT